MTSTKKNKININKYIIGTFDISKYTKEITTTTNDVVLLPERFLHIKKHSEILKHIQDIPSILNNPDLIYKENKRKDTIWIVKKINDNIKITIKLNTKNSQFKNYKNSIIQMQFMRETEIHRNLKNGNISKIFDKTRKQEYNYI